MSIVIDIVLVVVFAALGRASHTEALDVAGISRTALPFVAGTLIAWIALTLRKSSGSSLPAGAFVWALTLIGGMLFRVLLGDGTAVAFIIVAAVTLALFLLGWRLILWLVQRRTSATQR
ncbi:DUF3054 domain-containing protein [Propioniciclava flava]|uniref:DUF3054 domain-containing protein n=2 Tax=Propioniciclava flava TaxID=2072026 RepID=A0A4V1Q7T4_9ACTN|nr:DUF3054 domain-containing protein [Propioniciclava flava]